jgi:DNA topoisomerase-3
MNLFPRQSGGKSKEVIGTCPRCGGDVLEWDKVFSCANKACDFALFKESKYFSGKRIKLTKDFAKTILKDGRVYVKEIYSEQKDKTYSAYIVLNNDGGKYVSYKLDFGK